MARFELGKLESALEDLDAVLKELPDPNSNKEALELKQKITEQLKKKSPKASQDDSKPAPGFKRMQIVEASESEDEEEVPSKKASTPKKSGSDAFEPSSTFCGSRPGYVFKKGDQGLGYYLDAVSSKVSASASDSEIGDPHPEIRVEATKQGVENAKNTANSLFAQGKVAESVKWFTKAIWIVEAKKVDISADLHSILHSNRSFAHIKERCWSEAEADCSSALKFNCKNTKAKYRRAMARFELGKLESALEDLEAVLKELPDPNGNKEALELKQKITEQLKKKSPKASQDDSKPAPGFKRMQVVEASESEDEEEVPIKKPGSPAKTASPVNAVQDPFPDIEIEPTVEGIEQAKEKGNKLFAAGSIADAERCFSKAIWVAADSGRVRHVPVETLSVLHSNRAFSRLRLERWTDAEKDCCQALALNPKNTKALYRRAQARFELNDLHKALEDCDRLIPQLAPPMSSREAEELKTKIQERLGVQDKVQTPTKGKKASPDECQYYELSPQEASSSSTSKAKKPVTDPYPELHAEMTQEGVDYAKKRGSEHFSRGDVDSLERSVRWFSKGLWMVESGSVELDTDWAANTQAALLSNRSFAKCKLKKWGEAEADCTKALAFNREASKPNTALGVKIFYRRAMAREELGRPEDALEDVQAGLKIAPDAEELQNFREKLRSIISAKTAKAAEPASPSAAQRAAATRKPVARTVLRAPSVPTSSPKTSIELLRHFRAMSKHPSVMAQYLKERVSPTLLQNLFSKAPIEADDLATTLGAVRTCATDDGPGSISSQTVGDYLRCLVRTKSADTSFQMLSSSEKQVARDLLALVPASESKNDLAAELQGVMG
eukprot:TRINITY_DN7369_c0_g1_i4.p1 TRINITY_DN7369_c0_g1~~TRINITY_DN7369_c0_g1_i4.p1  ORF type:complete len:968 (-),score=280.72 TRINITY_DN7369_c0_g1_i4:521-3040(-)